MAVGESNARLRRLVRLSFRSAEHAALPPRTAEERVAGVAQVRIPEEQVLAAIEAIDRLRSRDSDGRMRSAPPARMRMRLISDLHGLGHEGERSRSDLGVVVDEVHGHPSAIRATFEALAGCVDERSFVQVGKTEHIVFEGGKAVVRPGVHPDAVRLTGAGRAADLSGA